MRLLGGDWFSEPKIAANSFQSGFLELAAHLISSSGSISRFKRRIFSPSLAWPEEGVEVEADARQTKLAY